jgi:hypothetical protein
VSDPSKPKEYPIKSFKGTIAEAVFSGQGILTFTNGDVYDGNFENGMREGKGIYRSAERDFEGEWEEDLLHGSAKIVFKEGTKGTVDDVTFDRGIPSCDWILPTITSKLRDSCVDKIERVDDGAVEACIASHEHTIELAKNIFRKIEKSSLVKDNNDLDNTSESALKKKKREEKKAFKELQELEKSRNPLNDPNSSHLFANPNWPFSIELAA